MASSSTSSPIMLKSSDGQTFELEEAAARMSVTIKNMIEDDCAGDEIPLPNVDSATLTKVAEYCKHHSAAAPGDESSKEFDKRFIADMNGNLNALFDLILASNYLAIKELMELTCQEVAEIIEDKSPEEVREIFNIKNDFTAEEEEEVRKENAWAYENIN